MNFQYRFHIRSKPRGSDGSDEENVKSLGPVTLLLKGQDLPVKSDDDKEVHPVPNKQHYNRKIYPSYSDAMFYVVKSYTRDDATVHLWDTTGRNPKLSWMKQHSEPTAGISFSPSNDKIIVSVGLDKKLYTYDSGSRRTTSCISYEAPFFLL
ncbi:hypothetical protein KIW84_075858 [Lathyrus oleraceus]|uniref:Uncharacterized protein n=1 Tax=Pisum sativum TaxID=3888 RepID=A0A9D5A029_PEA|nr:hypothetical protein KIW84_075858 [Pisum sativum]